MCLINQYSLLRTLAICAIGIACGSSSAFSDEIYSYTGPDYSLMDCTGTYVAHCTSDHLTGSLITTLSLSQLENLTSYSMPVSDTAFLFSDGNGLTLSQANATVSSLGITTNSSGNIVWWEIFFNGTGGSSFISTYSCLPSTCPRAATGGADYSGTSAVNSGGTVFEPYLGQIWSGPQFTAAPEGSGGFLVSTGLMILVGLRLIRRQFRLTSRG